LDLAGALEAFVRELVAQILIATLWSHIGLIRYV
jgi:hypothetical protein